MPYLCNSPRTTQNTSPSNSPSAARPTACRKPNASYCDGKYCKHFRTSNPQRNPRGTDFSKPRGRQLGDIRLFLKEKGKNSLELSARFHSHADITPQSVYSESHLDTLALCIFFALAKRYGGADTILLLDDVLSACDEAHLDRFIDLLHREAPHFAHVVVTTHYRAWRERYRQQRAEPNEIHFVDLKPWSLSGGIGCR